MGVFKFNDATLLLQKLQQQANESHRLSLFLSGHITLKVIFYHFHHYIFKVYKYSSPHFEKPKRVLFEQYPGAPLFLHLKQWRIANEAESLIQIQYATKPRNPE
jgi:hypothetical protein